MSFLNDDQEFFRYLICKLAKSTPADRPTEEFADMVFHRAMLIFDKVKAREAFASTAEHKTHE